MYFQPQNLTTAAQQGAAPNPQQQQFPTGMGPTFPVQFKPQQPPMTTMMGQQQQPPNPNVDNQNQQQQQAQLAQNAVVDMVEQQRFVDELTWQRLLGLDGSFAFIEHVFWTISLNVVFNILFRKLI